MEKATPAWQPVGGPSPPPTESGAGAQPPSRSRLPLHIPLVIGAGVLILVLSAILFVGFLWFVFTVDFLGPSHTVKFDVMNQANETLFLEIDVAGFGYGHLEAPPGASAENRTVHHVAAYPLFINLSEEVRDRWNLTHHNRLHSYTLNVTNEGHADLRFFITITPERTLSVRGPEVWVRETPSP